MPLVSLHCQLVLVVCVLAFSVCSAARQLDCIAREVRQNDLPFGGIQLIITGDFFQLPPVKAKLLAFEADCWNRCAVRAVAVGI